MMKKSEYISLGLSVLLIILIILVKYDILAFFDAKIYQICTFTMNNTLTIIFKVITFFGSTIFIVLFSIFLLFMLKDKKRRGVEYLLSLLLAMGMSTLLKLIIRRPRPNILPLVIEKTYSFPSGHTIAITTLVGFLIFLIWKEKKEEGKKGKKFKWIITIFLSLLALAVMFSRIYLGAHFFTDILGGIICALLALNITISLLEKKFNDSPTN